MKRFLLSVMAVLLFAIAPASAKTYIDANWVGANSDGTSPQEWKDLDTQHRAYSAAKESGHEAMANGEYALAVASYEKAAGYAIWSWTRAWQLNNMALAIIKTIDHEDGLTSSERAVLERALGIYEESLDACDAAKEVGKKLDQIEKCEATVNKSVTALLRTLGR